MGEKTELLDFTNPQFDLATGTQTSGGKTYWESQKGFFGRINYAYNQKIPYRSELKDMMVPLNSRMN